MRHSSLLLAGALAILAIPAAADTPQFDLTIKDHRFEPETLVVPAGTKIKLSISNLDPTPEEFESHELNREKIVPGGKMAIVFIGPLEAGEYRYYGEFNQDTAQGRIVAE
ncbi:MAG TPA: cupredoxin domain-containing protein [Gammaproteobacteria bacterium]|nr:cupredoxin domain-containing protein [Gammaproteobacteria bacterium]